MCLHFQLVLPISLFSVFISLHFGLDLKFSLWYFRVINVFILAKQSTLSPIFNSSAIALASLLILLYALLFVFRYVVEMFSVNNLLYLLMSVSYRLIVSLKKIPSFQWCRCADQKRWWQRICRNDVQFWRSGNMRSSCEVGLYILHRLGEKYEKERSAYTEMTG